jgi:hypothetical protein
MGEGCGLDDANAPMKEHVHATLPQTIVERRVDQIHCEWAVGERCLDRVEGLLNHAKVVKYIFIEIIIKDGGGGGVVARRRPRSRGGWSGGLPLTRWRGGWGGLPVDAPLTGGAGRIEGAELGVAFPAVVPGEQARQCQLFACARLQEQAKQLLECREVREVNL